MELLNDEGNGHDGVGHKGAQLLEHPLEVTGEAYVKPPDERADDGTGEAIGVVKGEGVENPFPRA